MKSLLLLVTTLLVSFFYNAQDWPIKGTKDWPSTKDFNDTCDVIPLGVDFGLCAMYLGWALTDSGCVVLSGCGWIGSDGVDYTSSFFSSSYQCNSACIQDTLVTLGCIDSNLIDPSIFCPDVIYPVCGCDSITYQNGCIALNYFGVSSFYDGECVTSNASQKAESVIQVFPNPNDGKFNMTSMPIGSLVRFYNVYGQIVEVLRLESSSVNMDLSHLPRGYYFFTINDGLRQKLLIE
ncbi:MAG: T9SS type A sorting domain-containing protein [Flavobacteriales bacterium]